MNIVDANFEDEIQLPTKTIIDQSDHDIYGEVDEQLQNFYDQAEDFEELRLEIFRKTRNNRGRFKANNNAYKKYYSATEFPIYLERLQEDLGAGEYQAKFCFIDEDGKKNYKFDGAFWQVSFSIDKSASFGTQADLIIELEKERNRTNMMFQEMMNSHKVLAESLAITKGLQQAQQTPMKMLSEYANFKEQLGNLLPEQKNNLDKIIGAVETLLPLFTKADSTTTTSKTTTTVEEEAKDYQITLAEKLKELTGE